jgi:hypothetical protein
MTTDDYESLGPQLRNRLDQAEMAARIADPSFGACRRMRPVVCGELGPWKPFYQGYVCDECITADRADVAAGRNPVGNGGRGKLFEAVPVEPG